MTKIERSNRTERSGRSRLVAGLFFVICAIPGLALLMIFSAMLLQSFFDPSPKLPHPLVSSAMVALGLVLILVGVDKWRQKGYLLVFLSIPVSLVTYMLIDYHAVGGKLAPGIVTGVVGLIVFYRVRRFYQRKQSPDNPKQSPE